MAMPKENNQLLLLCHPYMFALKEGRSIQHNLMDYSLLLLQRNCAEVVHSPSSPTRNIFINTLQRL